jgi:hypothetical protein
LTPRPTERVWRTESASPDSLWLVETRGGAQADEGEFGYESLSRRSCAVVVPADQATEDTVDQRRDVAVAPLVVGEGCLGLGLGELSMDWDEPISGDRDLERLVQLEVPVPLGFAAQSGDDDQLVLGSALSHHLQHRPVRPSCPPAYMGQSQESAAKQPPETPVVQDRGGLEQAAQERSGPTCVFIASGVRWG